jgi:hypothetical protein
MTAPLQLPSKAEKPPGSRDVRIPYARLASLSLSEDRLVERFRSSGGREYADPTYISTYIAIGVGTRQSRGVDGASHYASSLGSGSGLASSPTSSRRLRTPLGLREPRRLDQ